MALFRLRYLVVLAWFAGVSAATVSLPGIADVGEQRIRGLVPDDSEAIRAEVASIRRFQLPLLARTQVVQRDPGGLTLDAQARVVLRAADLLRRPDPELPALRGALPVVNTLGVFPGSREIGTTAITYLFFDLRAGLAQQVREGDRFARTRIGEEQDALVGVTGAAPARQAQQRVINERLPLVEGATVLLIALIVGLTFRAIVAPLVTLVSAGLAYFVSVRLVAWVGLRLNLPVPRDVEPLVVVLLLGIVTDYAVFFLSGMQYRLRAGDARPAAARRSTAEVTPIIVAAGLIVAAGSGSLLAARLGFLRAFGPALALSVLAGLAVSVTFLPAVMGILGRALFWPGGGSGGSRGSLVLEEVGTLRYRFHRFATRRPVALVVAALALAALVVPALEIGQMRLGFRLIEILPEDEEANRARDAAALGFSDGILAPTLLLLEGPTLSVDRPAIRRLEGRIRRERGVAGVIGPAETAVLRDLVARTDTQDIPGLPQLRTLFLSRDGTAARLVIIFDSNPYAAGAIEDLERLRGRMPHLLRLSGLEGVQASFAGDTALAWETISLTRQDLVRIGAVALLVSLVLLVLFLRALVAPLYLLGTSALGLAAALGITTFVFQEVLGEPDITYYVPFSVAVLLLSLGSDYNVFVVGRIWAEARGRPLREAVAVAVPRASRAISIAALALAGSFALLALVPLTPFLVFAFAMATGVLIEAFIDRSLLVPALITLVGPVSAWPGKQIRARGQAVSPPAGRVEARSEAADRSSGRE